MSTSSQVKPNVVPPTPPVKPGTGGTTPEMTQVSPRRDSVYLSGTILLTMALLWRLGWGFFVGGVVNWFPTELCEDRGLRARLEMSRAALGR